MEIFLELFGPISGSKWTYLGSKLTFLDLFALRGGKYPGNIIKMDDIMLPGPNFQAPLEGNIFWNGLDHIQGPNGSI
jgi:hypothetical protein